MHCSHTHVPSPTKRLSRLVLIGSAFSHVTNTTGASQVEGLRKVYPTSGGAKVAVKNFSLGIPRGECFGLLGINGAGKSTVLAILSGACSVEAFHHWAARDGDVGVLACLSRLHRRGEEESRAKTQRAPITPLLLWMRAPVHKRHTEKQISRNG